MEYRQLAAPDVLVESLVKAITRYSLDNRKVLWLISGGSALDVAARAAAELKGIKQLTIAQIDERFGPIGHKDSNWQQFIEKGFNPRDFTTYPLLCGKNIQETAERYNGQLIDLIDRNNTIIGLFGIGPDGHTAGILPHSEALEEQEKLVTYYEGSDFKRITITPAFFSKVDEAYVYAVGENKWPVLEELSHDVSVAVQPAQLLKQAKQVYVYTDKEGV